MGKAVHHRTYNDDHDYHLYGFDFRLQPDTRAILGRVGSDDPSFVHAKGCVGGAVHASEVQVILAFSMLFVRQTLFVSLYLGCRLSVWGATSSL